MRGIDENGIWTVVPVVGTTPGRRYGHTLAYTKPFLVVFGGNTGQVENTTKIHLYFTQLFE